MKKIFSKKKILKYLMLADVILILTMLLSLAFMSGFDEVTNRFKIKNMDIALYENNYSNLTNKQKSTLIPNSVLPKDPLVKNTDQTDAFVFIKVTVPVYNSTNVAPDGTITGSRRPQEVFFLKTAQAVNEAAASFHTKADEADKEYWVEIPSYEEGTDYQSSTRTYIFGYSVYLKPEEITETLFDYIELKNILQYEIDPDEIMDVTVDAYGIQADDLIGIEKNNGSEKNVMTLEQLTRIYGYVHENESMQNNNG